MLLNDAAGEGAPPPGEIGRGPRFFRWQAELPEPVEMDDTSPAALEGALPAAAEELIARRGAELDEIARRVVRFGPLPPDPPAPE
jgi:hypothetical protein